MPTVERETVRIDISKIPDCVRDRLVIGTIDAVRRFLEQPGGREILEKRIARNAEEAKHSSACKVLPDEFDSLKSEQ